MLRTHQDQYQVMEYRLGRINVDEPLLDSLIIVVLFGAITLDLRAIDFTLLLQNNL